MPDCCKCVDVCFNTNDDALYSVGNTTFSPDFFGDIVCDNHEGTKTYTQKVHLLEKEQECVVRDIDGISVGLQSVESWD